MGLLEGGNVRWKNINSLILGDRLGIRRFALFPFFSALGRSAEGCCVVIKIFLHLCQVAHVNWQPTSDAQGPKGPVMDCIIKQHSPLTFQQSLGLHAHSSRRPCSARLSIDTVSILPQQRGNGAVLSLVVVITTEQLLIKMVEENYASTESTFGWKKTHRKYCGFT